MPKYITEFRNLISKYIVIVIDPLTKLLLPEFADEKPGINSDPV